MRNQERRERREVGGERNGDKEEEKMHAGAFVSVFKKVLLHYLQLQKFSSSKMNLPI